MKTLREREGELRELLQKPGGAAELEHLASQYERAGGGPRGPSVVTYILVYERVAGLIRG